MNELELGRLIRQLRRERELTMIDFAKRIGVSQPSLSRIESGSQELSFPLLSKICSEFNMTISEFFFRLEGNSKLHDLQLKFNTEETRNIEDELEDKLHKMISTLSIEQRKALYVFLLPFIKD
ncbi:helix-turn-helix domain-containing protein [Virgibacillus oceani]|uniref:HTH cro/C1-type domain-containing protein n=1 Tax=Virgibacillus oceani TaxID=1479511 RepID=A0A917LW96_9BACI|nr:helix-turn-helix domain-containing protein [Virgibacillus oceani]GGG61231.1 hypothetical protein GCM10011398_00640 [Virgibacillus oceani]